MPRYNVQHPATKEWRCFSTIVNDYVTDWMDEERYQRWRLEEYGKQAGEIRDANLMDYEEAEQRIADRQKTMGCGRRSGRRDMMDEEIRQALNEVREMKQMCGNINMKLTNIVTQRGQDIKKKLEAEYQRGFEDGKAVNDKGCEGCKYQANRELTCPCSECANNFKNQWTAKDDKFEFGDEIIDSNGVKGCVVSKDNEESNMMYALFDGCRVPQYITQKKYRKTGKRYDIEKILGEMKA